MKLEVEVVTRDILEVLLGLERSFVERHSKQVGDIPAMPRLSMGKLRAVKYHLPSVREWLTHFANFRQNVFLWEEYLAAGTYPSTSPGVVQLSTGTTTGYATHLTSATFGLIDSATSTETATASTFPAMRGTFHLNQE